MLDNLSKNKSVVIGSLLVNVLTLGLLVYFIVFKPDNLDDSDLADFNEELISQANMNRLQAQSLLIDADSLLKNSETGQNLITISSQSKNDRAKECKPLADKRKYKIELGELVLSFRKGKPATVKGLNISRGAADSLLVQILVYDRAISNICRALVTLGRPETSAERQYVLDLMDKQQAIVDSYSGFKTAIIKSKAVDEVERVVKENKVKADSVTSGLTE